MRWREQQELRAATERLNPHRAFDAVEEEVGPCECGKRSQSPSGFRCGGEPLAQPPHSQPLPMSLPSTPTDSGSVRRSDGSTAPPRLCLPRLLSKSPLLVDHQHHEVVPTTGRSGVRVLRSLSDSKRTCGHAEQQLTAGCSICPVPVRPPALETPAPSPRPAQPAVLPGS